MFASNCSQVFASRPQMARERWLIPPHHFSGPHPGTHTWTDSKPGRSLKYKKSDEKRGPRREWDIFLPTPAAERRVSHAVLCVPLTGGRGKMQTLIQQLWRRAWDLACLISSLVVPTLLFYRPHTFGSKKLEDIWTESRETPHLGYTHIYEYFHCLFLFILLVSYQIT